jgi:hypothetical protein
MRSSTNVITLADSRNASSVAGYFPPTNVIATTSIISRSFLPTTSDITVVDGTTTIAYTLVGWTKDIPINGPLPDGYTMYTGSVISASPTTLYRVWQRTITQSNGTVITTYIS